MLDERQTRPRIVALSKVRIIFHPPIGTGQSTVLGNQRRNLFPNHTSNALFQKFITGVPPVVTHGVGPRHASGVTSVTTHVISNLTMFAIPKTYTSQRNFVAPKGANHILQRFVSVKAVLSPVVTLPLEYILTRWVLSNFT